jgi:aryl-alcohol dehydrogenase-like predicted oxidoreductase
MVFGGQTDEAESLSIMNYAFENGINVFDTANIYTRGESEKIVGKGLKGRREKIILATKVCNRTSDDPNDAGLSRRHILNALEASLKRMQTDYIDIYYLHAPDPRTSLEETFDTMSGLVRCGKVRYIGVSNFAAWQIADILALCDKRGYVAPVITQNVYNALTRGIEAELVPFLDAHGMNLTVYNPIAGGLLAGKHKPGEPAGGTRFSLNKMYADRYWSDENFAAVERFTGVARESGLSLLQLAMKWCAAQKAVTSIITGVSRLSQLEQNIQSVQGDPLGADILERCDEVWKSLAGTRFAYMR